MGEQVSDLGLGLGPRRRPGSRPSRRQRSRRARGCLAGLIALAVLLGVGYLAFAFGLSALKGWLSPPDDYKGAGSGQVLVEVQEGQAAIDIAATLFDKQVVKSREAFTDAAREDPASVGIQAGFYQMKQHMSAKSALAVLVDPENRMRSVVTIPEGYTVEQIVAALAKRTDFAKGRYDEVLAEPAAIGLPVYAEGNPEGYLFPATYEVPPKSTPRSVLTMMVRRFQEAAKDQDLVRDAEAIGRSPHDVMTVASLVQAEARNAEDFSRVARVIYNRLSKGMRLQFDSTVHYAVGKDGSVSTSQHRPTVRLAVQHLSGDRTAADTDLGTRRAGDQGRAPPGIGDLAVLRHHQPGHGGDEVRHEVCRPPEEQGGVRPVVHGVRHVLSVARTS